MKPVDTVSDGAALAYMRYRRATYFFGDRGPALPHGTQARWRLTVSEPQGWHANMVGFIQGSGDEIADVIDIARDWFTQHRVDTWVDADEWTPLFMRPDILEQREFQLIDDWDMCICRRLPQPPANSAVQLEWAHQGNDLQLAAWVAEQIDSSTPLALDALPVLRRLARYRTELRDGFCRFALARLDGQVVGSGRVTNERVPVVVGIATLPGARNHGVATATTAFLTAYALQQRGIGALYVDRGSQAARLYGRLGYSALFRTCAWRRPYLEAAPAQTTDGTNACTELPTM